MTGSQLAYSRAHAELTQIIATLGDTAPHEAAAEILATLHRTGWRWTPRRRPEEPARGPAAPLPPEWAEQRRRALQVAEQHTECVRKAEK